MMFWVGLFVGVLTGIVVHAVDVYYENKSYFDKIRERERWKKS